MRLSLRAPRHVTLRISAPDGESPRHFEVLLVIGRRHLTLRRLQGQTPFETVLPNEDVTIVATATEPGAPLEVTYEVTRRGRRVLSGWSSHPIAVIQRRRRGIAVGGLDGPAGENGSGTPAFLRAM